MYLYDFIIINQSIFQDICLFIYLCLRRPNHQTFIFITIYIHKVVRKLPWLDAIKLSSKQPHIWMGRSRVRVGVIQNIFKMVLTAPQSVLVIISLSKENALSIKRRSSYLIQWTSRQRWYNSKSWLSDKIKVHKIYEPI